MSTLSSIARTQPESPILREHAVVIGASMAGLLASRVLSDYFQRVTLIDRDDLPEQVENRQGVPQGRHLHTLLVRGEQIISNLFPGIDTELVQAGATKLDMPGDVLWFQEGGYKIRFNSGIIALFMSRPLLEYYVRRRVLAVENLTCLQHCDVKHLNASSDHTRVTGVKIQQRTAGSTEVSLAADLVVDATGRASRSPKWLEALGYPRPEESAVKVDITYTSRTYRQNRDLLPNAKGLVILPAPPDVKRAGGLFPIEGGRWILTLAGWLGEQAPRDEQGFLEFAKGLASPDIYHVISRAEPLSDFVVHRFPSSLHHHYERMTRFPEGYLVTGDALCSFDPVYGQGMSVSAMEAEALDRCLEQASQRNSLQGLSHDFFHEAVQAIKNPWMLAVGEDFRFPGVTGPKPVGIDLTQCATKVLQRKSHPTKLEVQAI